MFRQIAEAPSDLEALEQFAEVDERGNMRGVSDILKIRQQCAKGHTIEIRQRELPSETLWPWQAKLMKMVGRDPALMSNEEFWGPHARQVFWIYDPLGTTGKSTFCRVYQERYPKWGEFSKNITDVKGLINTLSNKVKEGEWLGKALFVDLPREIADYNICTAIEQIKDGGANSTKYQGCELKINSPHVVVFANELPTSKIIGGFSNDRWQIYQVGHMMKLHKLGKQPVGNTWIPLEKEIRAKSRKFDNKHIETEMVMNEKLGQEMCERIHEGFRWVDKDGNAVGGQVDEEIEELDRQYAEYLRIAEEKYEEARKDIRRRRGEKVGVTKMVI